MTSINRVQLLGALGQDADVRTMPDGETRLANISVATSRRHKTRSGEWTESTDWHRCVIWYPHAQLLERLRKGARVLLEGRLQTRSWQDARGDKRYATEVVATGSDVLVVAAAPEKRDGQWQRPPVIPETGPSAG